MKQHNLHRQGRRPITSGTEGANPTIPCGSGVKLSGKWTLPGRTSGESYDAEGANPTIPCEGGVNLSGH
jgi:hypothetical protein